MIAPAGSAPRIRDISWSVDVRRPSEDIVGHNSAAGRPFQPIGICFRSPTGVGPRRFPRLPRSRRARSYSGRTGRRHDDSPVRPRSRPRSRPSGLPPGSHRRPDPDAFRERREKKNRKERPSKRRRRPRSDGDGEKESALARATKAQKVGCNTRTSSEVTHPSTTLAQARLTLEF
jgi:hypothetical protein